MRRKIIVFCVACCLGFSPAFLQAADYYVKENGSGNGSSWETAMSFDDLVDIIAIEFGGNFHFAEGTYYIYSSRNLHVRGNANFIGGYPADAVTGTVSKPDIYKATIIGELVTVNTNSAAIAADTYINITVKGLIFKNFPRQSAIRVLDICSLTVENCIFENNSNPERDLASAVRISRIGTVNIDKTVFRNNGGVPTVAIWAEPGQPDKTRVLITNSIFENNTSSIEQGGVLFFRNTSNNYNLNDDYEFLAVVRNCTFYHNGIFSTDYPIYRGGAIYAGRVQVLAENNTFVDNFNGFGDGTVIYMTESDVRLTNNTIISNSNSTTDCVFGLYKTNLTLTGNILVDRNNNLAICKDRRTTAVSTITAKHNILTPLTSNICEPLYYLSVLADEFDDPSNRFIDLTMLSQMLEGQLSSGGVFTPALQNNGGFTNTVALHSPEAEAIRTVPTSLPEVPATDQRGVARWGEHTYVGAYALCDIQGYDTDVSFTGLTDTVLYCRESDPIELTPSMAGGTFSGMGIINGNQFSPALVTEDNTTIRYTIVYQDGCSNFSEQTVNISQKDAGLQLEMTIEEIQNALCYGDNGSIRFAISGGNGKYTYTINNGEEQIATDTEVSLPLPAGDYTIDAWQTIDKCAGKISKSFSITQPQLLQATLMLKNLACEGATDGAITVNASGGTLPYQYTLTCQSLPDNISDLNIFENLSAGNYQISMTDKNNCEWETNTAVVNLNLPKPVITNLSVKNQSCYGVANGAITVSYTAHSDYPIQMEVLQNGEVLKSSLNNTITGLAPGMYDLKLRYAMSSQCASLHAVEEFMVDTIAPLSVSKPSYSHQTCLSPPNGKFEVKIGGWANEHVARLNNTTAVRPTSVRNDTAVFAINTLSGGEYFLFVKNECDTEQISSDAVTIQGVKPYKFDIIDEHVSLDCSYSNDGYVELKIDGGYVPAGIVYMLDNRNDKIQTVNPIPADSIVLLNGLPKGQYQIVYATTQEGCTDNTTMNKPVTAPEGVNFITDTLHISCFGMSDGEISLLAHQGLWQPEKVPVTAENRRTVMQNNGYQGFNYTWIKTDNPDFEFENQTFPLEKFWADYYGDTIYKGVVGVQNLPAGTYICEVSINENKCHYKSDTILVMKPTYDSLRINNIVFNESAANCYINDRRIEIEVAGGWKGYVYAVLNEAEYLAAIAGNSTDDDDDHPVGAGSGGWDDDESNVPEITYDPVNNTGAYKSEILLPDNYYIFVTDSMGCMVDTASYNYRLSIDPTVKLRNLHPVDSLLCPRDSSGVIELQAEGGAAPYIYKRVYSYSQDSMAILDITANSVVYDQLTKGFYSFIAVEDRENGCEGFNTFEIKDNKEPFMLNEIGKQDVSCYNLNDGELIFYFTGGTMPYSFRVDDNSIDCVSLPSNQFKAAGIGGGTHTLYISDPNLCKKTLNFELNEPKELKVNEVKGSEVCKDEGRLVLNNVSGGTLPYSYSLFENSGYQKDYTLKAGLGTRAVFVKDANNCIASGSGTVTPASGKKLPELKFLASTWSYASDVLVLIDVSEDTSGRDSLHFYFNNDLIYEEDPRIYTYGVKDSLDLIQLLDVSDNEKAGIYKNIYLEDVISRMSFISLKKDVNAANLIPESDSIFLSFSVTMRVYYDNGCDDEITNTVYIANEKFDIYPEGKITQKQPDILKLTVYPNPANNNDDFSIEIEFANKVDFYVSMFTVNAIPIVSNQHFAANRIGSDMKATIQKSELGSIPSIVSSAVIRVNTKTDAASIVLIMKD